MELTHEKTSSDGLAQWAFHRLSTSDQFNANPFPSPQKLLYCFDVRNWPYIGRLVSLIKMPTTKPWASSDGILLSFPTARPTR
jgi:hypothetical protein